MTQNGKGSERRKGEDTEKFRENFPLKDAFVPKWKKDLEEFRRKQGG